MIAREIWIMATCDFCEMEFWLQIKNQDEMNCNKGPTRMLYTGRYGFWSHKYVM